MHIRKLEIFGFKSFKNKTVLEFDREITGVVGPNGCGKSNIVDALLWVMGETAPKHLRGASFSDVIFSGSAAHPAGDLAEVSLTLTKGDGTFPEPHNHFSELMITRRAFRNGETEYQINRQTCRLKDIHEVFMNTGAGRRGFSIIEQEAVEKLITAGPAERRFIIEETAGITKFKARRTESLRKLSKVNQNLQRIEDILKTREQQFQTLNRQAQKAERYRALKENLRKRDIEISHRLWSEISKTQMELQERERNCAGIRRKMEDKAKISREQLKKQETEIQKISAVLEKEKLYLSDVSCKIVEREKEIEKRKSAVSIYKENRDAQKVSGKGFQKETADREQRIKELELRKEGLKSSEDRLRKEIRSLESFLSTAEEKHSGREKSIEQQIEKDREALHRTAVRDSVVKNRLEILTKNREGLSRNKSLLENQLRRIFKEKTKRAETLEKSQQMKLNFDKSTEDLERNIQVLTVEKQRTEEKTAQRKRDISILKHQAENIERLIHKYENLPKGGQALRAWKPDQFKPLITDLKVRPGFENAVEAALGLFLKALLTPDNYFIESGIDRLRENKKGKCVFVSALPFNKKPPFDREELKKYPAFICSLDEKMTFTLEMEPLRALARRTVVVSDLRSAFDMKNRYPDLQFVTKEGDLITRESFVYGGSHEKDTNIMKMQNERAFCLQETAEREQTLRALEEERKTQTRRLEALLKERKQTTENQSQTNIFIAEHKKDMERFETEIFRLTEEQEALRKWEKETEEEEQSLQTECDTVREERQTLHQAVQTKESVLSQIQKAKTEYETAEKKLSALKVTLVENLNNQNLHEKERSLLMNLVNLSRNREKEFAGNFQSIQKTIHGEEAKIREISKELNLFYEEKEQVTFQIQEMERSEERLFDTVKKTRNRLEDSANEQNRLEREADAFQSEREKMDIQKQNVKDKLLENHQFRLEEDSFIPEWEEISVDQLKESIEKLKKELENTGAVNLTALKERDTLMEKNEFLNTQKDDLTKSKKDLLKVISHIDGICNSRFEIMLREINLRFSRIFPLIFNGENSSARLILKEDPEKGEPGVDIEIRPPGKKIQNTALLSRGEKALASLCLIYSLFLVKPSPFCVLDEIDAPLDDANVLRFLSVMREMAKKSQIITVTHNKHTMRFCSRLYGVTMREKGVSQIVSVQLETSDLSPAPPPAGL